MMEGHEPQCTCKSWKVLVELVLSYLHVDSRDQTWVAWLDGMCFHLLSP